MKKRAGAISLAVVIFLFLAVYFWGPSVAPPGQKPLTKLSAGNFSEFEAAFDAASAGPRLLVLVSPT